MGYEDNAFNSPAGIELLKQNFRLVFAPSTQDPTQIDSRVEFMFVLIAFVEIGCGYGISKIWVIGTGTLFLQVI
jgi:hypothetical protein